MRFSLRTKLFALTTFVVTLIMATVTYLVTVRERLDRVVAAEAEVARIAQNIATLQLVDGQDWGVYQQYISRLLDYNRDIVYIAIYDARRSLRAHALNVDLVELGGVPARSRSEQAAVVTRLDDGAIDAVSRDDLRAQRVNIQSGDRVLGSVHVGFSLIAINRDLRRGVERNVLLAAAFLALSGVLAFVLSRRLTGPLERLSAAMSAISRGDLEQQVLREGSDEIGELAMSFNAMVGGLRERRTIDRFGRDLGCEFQVGPLAELIRREIGEAVGGVEPRLFLRDRDAGAGYRELGGRSAVVAEVGSGWPIGVGARVVSEVAASASLVAAGLGEADAIVPLQAKERVLGFLAMRLDGPFAESRRRFAETLAAQAGLALENALLYRDLSEQERLKGELAIARAVQKKLLPRALPVIAGWAFDAVCEPAYEVGGDYYDFVRLSDGRLGVVVADVSGKGASASLYMAEIKGLMLSLLSDRRSPRELVLALNQHLYPSLDRRVFVSMMYGILDPESARFCFVRAGQGPLYVVSRDGHVTAHTPTGVALGIDPGALLEKLLHEETVALAPGDTLVLWTDGLSDALATSGDRFGEAQVRESLCRHAAHSPRTMRESLLHEVAAFAGDGARADDLTVVLIRHEGTGRDPGPYAE